MGPAYDMSKPLGKRRPKVMERMPDPPPGPFQLDDAKFREATQPNEKWLDTFGGKLYLGVGYVLLSIVGVAILAVIGAVLFAFPGLLAGVVIAIAIAVAQYQGSDRRR